MSLNSPTHRIICIYTGTTLGELPGATGQAIARTQKVRIERIYRSRYIANEKSYPAPCLSSICGNFGGGCTTCSHREKQEDFKAWVKLRSAVVADTIHDPNSYIATQ